MGLRINHNIPAMMALRNLRINDRMQQRSLERLSTGDRINRASDDPSGLVISERLRAQISGLKQAVENSQNASNLIGTAEAALNEVQALLVGIRENMLFAINSGGNSPEQISAEQDAVDNTIGAIDRIAQTTRFGTRSLLNGVSGFTISARDAAISELTLRNVQFSNTGNVTFDATITSIASQAELSGDTYVGGTAGTVRISGALGVEDISVAVGTTVGEFDAAVNALAWNTGVVSSAGVLSSIEYGSSESITFEVTSGTVTTSGGAQAAGYLTTDTGADITGTVEGTPFTGIGNKAALVSNFLTAEILFKDGQSTGTYSFTVEKSGLTFQLNGGTSMNDRETVGIASVNTSLLGMPIRTVAGETIGGYLSSMSAGGANDLFNDPINGLRIIDAAIDDVSDMRAYLGAFQAFTIESNVNSLDVAIENLTSAESTIRDLDFAEETSNFTRTQILYQAGIAVMAQANLIPQSVLTLLQ